MFALLEHRPSSDGPAETPTHWDLLVEWPGQDGLATWRLGFNPLDADTPVPATPMAAHRRLYLEYEGPISGGRGTVRRLDAGPAHVWRQVADRVVLLLEGRRLRGSFELVATTAGQVFRRCSADAARPLPPAPV